MGHQFQQQQAEPLNKGAASFVDLVPKLRRLGTECLLDQMSSQKAELLELLGGAQGRDCRYLLNGIKLRSLLLFWLHRIFVGGIEQFIGIALPLTTRGLQDC